jgi:hypothetical protein
MTVLIDSDLFISSRWIHTFHLPISKDKVHSPCLPRTLCSSRQYCTRPTKTNLFGGFRKIKTHWSLSLSPMNSNFGSWASPLPLSNQWNKLPEFRQLKFHNTESNTFFPTSSFRRKNWQPMSLGCTISSSRTVMAPNPARTKFLHSSLVSPETPTTSNLAFLILSSHCSMNIFKLFWNHL